MAPFLKGKKGKAVMIGIAAADNTIMAKTGYMDTLKILAPGIEVNPNVYDTAGGSGVGRRRDHHQRHPVDT